MVRFRGMEMNGNDLFDQVITELDAGNFTRLERLLSDHNASLVDLLVDAGGPKEHLDEAFAWACMVGRAGDAERLLDLGADPVAGMKTGLAGAHYAASGGHFEAIRMIIRRGVPLETVNMYGGTVLGQALYSAVREHKDSHTDIIKALIEAGAVIETGTIEWWNEQYALSPEEKETVAEALRNHMNTDG